MTIENSGLAPAKNSESLPRTALTAARPFGPVLAPERPKEKKPYVLHADRRRAQRVMLRVHACVHVSLQGTPTTLETTTMNVSSAGALLILNKGLPVDCRLVLEHGQSKERVACHVTRPARETPEGFHVSVEFDSPAPNFWGIAFPPPDWRPVD